MSRLVVPPGEGRGLKVAAGTTFNVVDIEGGQVGDLFAFVADDPQEYASAEHTRPSIGPTTSRFSATVPPRSNQPSRRAAAQRRDDRR
ncbi:MAG TPA: DUF1989 domain-containing protein, partial [Candidatus Dormibacteraeota bacterium]|nr:DUF1989 domain-containing protein [Candidatus Dormibacteraeota bacterium]